MSDELSTQDIHNLLKSQQETLDLLVHQQKEHQEKPDVVEKSGKYFNWVQGLIALIAVVLSIGMSYGVATVKLENLESQIETMQAEHKEQITKLDGEVHVLQMAQVRDDTVLESIRVKLDGVAADVKKLLEGDKND